MSGFIVFLAYALVCVAFLGLLWWGLQQVNLPAPIKTVIIVIIVAVGVIYFFGGGALPELRHG